MTVKELIKKLQKMPENQEVLGLYHTYEDVYDKVEGRGQLCFKNIEKVKIDIDDETGNDCVAIVLEN